MTSAGGTVVDSRRSYRRCGGERFLAYDGAQRNRSELGGGETGRLASGIASRPVGAAPRASGVRGAAPSGATSPWTRTTAWWRERSSANGSTPCKNWKNVKRDYERDRREHRVALTKADRAAIRALARDLPTVWRPTLTPNADRKAMLRLVIEAISLQPVDVPRLATLARIAWKTDAVSEVFLPKLRAAREAAMHRLVELAAQGLCDTDIARKLNEEVCPRARERRGPRSPSIALAIRNPLRNQTTTPSPPSWDSPSTAVEVHHVQDCPARWSGATERAWFSSLPCSTRP